MKALVILGLFVALMVIDTALWAFAIYKEQPYRPTPRWVTWIPGSGYWRFWRYFTSDRAVKP